MSTNGPSCFPQRASPFLFFHLLEESELYEVWRPPYSRTSISVTPISVIISYMLRKFYSPTKTQFVGLVNVMC